MNFERKQGLYRRYDQRKGEKSRTQRSPVATLAQLEHEISQLEDELEELKAYKKELEENVEVRKKVKQKLELHKYGSGIVVISVTENEVVFEFNAMVRNSCTESYCMRVAELEDSTFSVLKYYMPICMDVRGLLKKPEFQSNIRKYLNHIHSCLRAYNDRKLQVKQAESSLNKNGIKIANTMDYRLLEITLNVEDNKNKEVTVVVVLKYKDNEIRPNSISIEGKDLSNAASEEIRDQLNYLHIYSLELGLQLCLLKNDLTSSSSENSNKVNNETSIESASTVELPQDNFRHLEVDLGMFKRIRGRGRASLQQHSVESELETSVEEEEEDKNKQIQAKSGKRGRGVSRRGRGSLQQHSVEYELETSVEEEDQNKQKPRRGRERGSSHGSEKRVPFIKQVQVDPGNTERGVRRRGKGRGGRTGSNKGRTLDISKYFERSNPS